MTRRVIVLLIPALCLTCEDPEPFHALEICNNGRDDDNDNIVDCDDISCLGDPACSSISDGDGDLDADSDGDSDSDADAVLDADPDDDLSHDAFDGDTDSDGELDGDSPSDSEIEADTEIEADGDVELDADSESIDPCLAPIICTSDTDCPEPTLRCYDYYLDGVPICAPRGQPCSTDDDCSEGVPCDAVPCWYRPSTHCLTVTDDCADASDCPEGFTCETSSCVDRRHHCMTADDCPWWDGCISLLSGARVCQPLSLEPCHEESECGGGFFACVDVEGDGDTECQPDVGGECLTNDDCVDAVCGDADGDMLNECGVIGPCLGESSCPPTHECVDVNGDGQLECQGLGGTCLTNLDCLPGQICFDSDGIDGPECL